MWKIKFLRLGGKMEIKSELLKPYTDKQRMDFIIEQNHQNGYEIKETETALEAWGYTDEEKQERERERRNQEIDEKIKELQIMALPEVLNGNIENIKLYNNVIDGLNKARL